MNFVPATYALGALNPEILGSVGLILTFRMQPVCIYTHICTYVRPYTPEALLPNVTRHVHYTRRRAGNVYFLHLHSSLLDGTMVAWFGFREFLRAT